MKITSRLHSFLLALTLANAALPIACIAQANASDVDNAVQQIALPFAGTNADQRIILILNNNRPSSLKVKATAYTPDGSATPLPAFDLVASESRMMELSPILRKAGLNGQPLGYLEVSYKGVFLGLGAQLTLYPGGGLTGIDSARTVSGDYKTGNCSASFWLPEWGKSSRARAVLLQTLS